MYKLLSLIVLLFQTLNNVEGLCSYFENYSLLGVVKSTNIKEHMCKNYNKACTYVSLNIPGLVIGSFSGCPEETNQILSIILTKRLDTYYEFENIFSNNTGKVDHDLLCQRSLDGDQPYQIDTISGKAKFFVHCYNQNETYTLPGVQYNPPTTSATPVKCNSGQNQTLCTEGYCGMLEISSITPNGVTQISQRYQYCPNDIFIQLYIISTGYNNTFNQALHKDLHNIGPFCSSKTKVQELYKNGLSSYFWYVNCYVPNNTNTVQFPKIPDLMFYATTTTTTTTTQNPIMTTTKLAFPSSNLSIVTITLFIITSFIFKQ